MICSSPLFVREYAKRRLIESISNDTLMLSQMKIIDYSLLVGVDEERNELVIGIVGKYFKSPKLWHIYIKNLKS